MKKYIATIFVLILSLSFINAVEFKKEKNIEQIFSSKIKITTPTFFDKIRCTCGGEACGSSFDSSPNAVIGNVIVYCARLCSCDAKVGFTYETEN